MRQREDGSAAWKVPGGGFPAFPILGPIFGLIFGLILGGGW
jgi:flagellar motor component MotA